MNTQTPENLDSDLNEADYDDMSKCLISVGIPLYKSKPFLENIRENCKVLMLREDIEIIISDQHCMDDSIVLLEQEWGDDQRFIFLKSTKAISWIAHMNLLLSKASGEYFRWMPHDDVFPKGCLEPLIKRLDSDRQVILAYGPTRGIDLNGNRLPDRDRINTSPVKPFERWRFQYSLDFFSNCYCDGAFKGLFRRKPIVDAGLFIAKTYQVVGAERAWLFGVSLLGGFGEEPDSIYLKRYHAQSTHAQWKISNRHRLSITASMAGYLWTYCYSSRKSIFGIIYLWRKTLKQMIMAYWSKLKKKV